MTPPSPPPSAPSAPSAQQARRQRILAAAAALGAEGDFEAVQMRLVAERADVALGTLYRYFPSKIHLLVAVLIASLQEVETSLREDGLPGRTPSERVIQLAHQSIQAQQENARLHAAMIRAYVFVGESSPIDNAQVSALIRTILCQAMRPDGALTDEDIDVAGVIADVWLSATVAWVAGRLTADEVTVKMERAARLLLDD